MKKYNTEGQLFRVVGSMVAGLMPTMTIWKARTNTEGQLFRVVGSMVAGLMPTMTIWKARTDGTENTQLWTEQGS